MRRLSLMAGVLVVCLATARCGSKGGDITGPAQVVTVRVTPETRQIAATETASFAAEALDANGSVLSGKAFTFSSSNPAVATVADPAANPATVTAVATGVATITATTEGKSGSANLTVSGQPDIQVAGRVVDGATGLGIAAATIDAVYLGLGGGGTRSTVTVGDGSFSFAVPDNGNPDGRPLDVTATATGYVSTTLISARVRAPSTQIESILLVQQTSVKGAISGTVRNARTNQGIPNIQVFLSKGQGILGSDVGQFTSDANGGFTFTQLDAGTYTLQALPDGFQAATRTAITVVSGASVAQDLILSPVGANLIVVVLTWGANPSDLDAHLTGPNADPSRFHVYYPSRGDLTAPPFAALDVDDTQSFGPETITITQLNSGVYRYSVHDFSNRSSASSAALGASGAKVELSFSTGTQSFFVPNQPGTLWTVFELSGNIASPTITARNAMGLAEDPDGILLSRDQVARYGGEGKTDASLIGRAIRTVQKAQHR